METLYDNAESREDNTPGVSLFNNALKYGVITGVAYILLSLLLYSFDLSGNTWAGYVSFLVLIGGIVAGTITYRDKHSGGYLSYKRCLGSGVLISLVAGVLMGIYSFVFFQFFDPEMINKMLELAGQNMADKGMTEDQIDQAMNVTRKFMTPLWMTITSLLSIVFWGTIFSLIASIFIKKEDPNFDNIIA
ncbi:DUF4199 domain-containing protein [Lentimicrobium sp.]